MTATHRNRAGAQLTLSFDATLAERWATLREYIAYRAQAQEKQLKIIAADMDMTQSMLSRKLNPKDEDTQRFNCDDLEGYIESTGDLASVIEYLASKFGQTDEARKARALDRFEQMLPALEQVLTTLRGERGG